MTARPSLVARVRDGLANAITRIGTERDPRTASTYVATRLTQHDIANALSGSGLMRKIITIPPLDMVREWRDWKAEPDAITAIEAEEKRLALRQKVRAAETLRALGGGAFVLGLPGEISQPAPGVIRRGDLAFIHVVSRWQLRFDAVETDAREALFGEPLMWKMQQPGGGDQLIHPSRVIAFRGEANALLPTVGVEDAYWGESRVAQVLDAVQDCDTARAAFAALIHKARLLRVGIPNLSDTVATPGGEEQIAARLRVMAMAESIHSATIYDSGNGQEGSGEQIGDVSYSFAGIRDVMNTYGEFAAAISDIPATRLLGRAPEGMNSSGDSQQRDWNKRVRAMQTLDLAPCLDRLDGWLIQSALGTRPPGIWSEFAPLDQPSQAEEATRFKTLMEAAEKLQATGAIPDVAFTKGMQSLMIDEGFMPGLEGALGELPEEERFGIQPPDPSEADPGDLSTSAEVIPLRRAANDATPRTLYVQRKLLNAEEFIAWAKGQGFDATLAADDLHVTVAYSRAAVDWMKVGESWSGKDGELVVEPGGARLVEPLGDSGAVVLLFNSSQLAWRHEEIRRAGASWDYLEYQPHVTITWTKPDGLDLATVEPFRGELRFGPEIFEELVESWKEGVREE